MVGRPTLNEHSVIPWAGDPTRGRAWGGWDPAESQCSSLCFLTADAAHLGSTSPLRVSGRRQVGGTGGVYGIQVLLGTSEGKWEPSLRILVLRLF